MSLSSNFKSTMRWKNGVVWRRDATWRHRTQDPGPTTQHRAQRTGQSTRHIAQHGETQRGAAIDVVMRRKCRQRQHASVPCQFFFFICLWRRQLLTTNELEGGRGSGEEAQQAQCIFLTAQNVQQLTNFFIILIYVFGLIN